MREASMQERLHQLYRGLPAADAHCSGVTLGTGRYPEVAQLLPDRPPGAKKCHACDGTGYIRRDSTGRGVVCPECAGLGWKSP